MNSEDEELLNKVESLLKSKEIRPYIAEHDTQPGKLITQKIKQEIDNCNILLALLTKHGDGSRFVHQEIGYAHGQSKLVIPVVEIGVDLTGFDFGNDYISLDRNDPSGALVQLEEYATRIIEKAIEKGKTQR